MAVATEALQRAHVAALEHATTRITLAIEDRDEAIRQAYADGMSAAEIGRAVGLTRGRVHQLLKASS
jgi:DNA-directed RNA polymerase specialized sigma24 family protein